VVAILGNARREDQARLTETAKTKGAWAHSAEIKWATVAQGQSPYCMTEDHEGRNSNGSHEPKTGLLAVTEEKTGWRNQFEK
jgi:hypothetical protein